MPKFQVVSIKPLSGVSQKTNRPWNMLIYSGMFTNDDGSVELGELSMMLADGQPAPNVKPGETYSPVVSAQARQGKLEFRLLDLKPLVAAKSLAAAAA